MRLENTKSDMSSHKVILYLYDSENHKKQELISYCRKNDWEIVHVFEEEQSFFEKSVSERPHLCALVQFLQYDLFDFVVVSSYTDLVKNKEELDWILGKIQKAKKQLKVISGNSLNNLIHGYSVEISHLEKEYTQNKELLEKKIDDCFFKDYPDQYSIVIGIHKCFIDCISCTDVLIPKDIKSIEMDFDLFKKCIDYIPDNVKDIVVILCPGGETLTFKNLIPMIQYITDKKPDVISNIPTNGILLNDEMIMALIEAGLSNIMISINAYDKEDYKWFTNSDAFEVVEQNIYNFAQIKKKLHVDKPVLRVQIFGIKRFEKKIDKFIDKWKDVVDSVEVTPLSYCSKIPELENIDKYKAKCDFPIVKTCNFLFRNMMIYPDGTIFPCPVPTPVMQGKFPLSLGNINNVNPFEIWNSKRYLDLRETNLRGEPIMDECFSCNRIVSGDWTVVDTLEEDLFRKEKFKKTMELDRGKYGC